MRSSESGSEEEDEELVAPLEAPAASAAAADGGATAEATSSWQFDAWRRDSLSRSRTRHSSLDAGHLEHRAYTALQALEGRASALPQHHSAGSIHSSSRPSARQAQRNEDIEIGWVWPPCLANDAGPVEFAVNVAPKEWLTGKRFQRRVPCWPVSGLSLHITFGEQLLEMVDLDICGTTKVRLHLPPALMEHKLNFITVMLVDHGSVGPATQLLLMPSSAADEFSGLFRVLVEHAMLPQSAAHPEYVSMLFGSSGCSSASSMRSYDILASLNGSSLAPMPPLPRPSAAVATAAAAAVSSSLVCPFNPADALMPGTTAAGAAAAGQDGSPQHQTLQQQQQQQGPTSRVRRSSWIDIQGQPAVVRSWGASAQRGVSPGKERGATGLEQQQERRRRSSRRRSCGPGSGGSADRAGGTANGKQRRASTGVECSGAAAAACAAAAAAAAPGSPQDSQQPAVFYSTSGQNLETVVSCNGDSAPLPVLLGDSGSVVSSGDADEEGRLAAVAAAVAAELQQEGQQEHEDAGAAVGLASDGRRTSLSLDRCAVHVHNEVERAQHTRSRMSLEEPSHRRVSLDLAFASDALSRAAAQGGSHAHALSAAAAAAGGGGGGVGHATAGSTAQSLAAAAAAFLAHTPPTAAGPAAAANAGGGSAPVSAHLSLVAPVTRSGHSATVAGSAAAAELGEKLLQVQQQNLERRSYAEAHMAAAFTTAWSSHMLELASDLQYLVVCVPNAFASNLEAWFGRIVDSRSSSSGGAAGLSARATESTWDSGMYMNRLGEVLGTLQENGMWRTMSLLLKHCSKGGLDLYPAGRLHEQLQQQAKLQHAGSPSSPSSSSLVAGGPLDPTTLTPEYLLHLGSLDIGPAHGWVRPVPAITNVAMPKWGRLGAGGGGGGAAGRSGSNGFRPAGGAGAPPAASAAAGGGPAGLMQQREAAAAKGRRGVTSIDLTPASLSDARAAAARAAAAAGAAAGAGRGGEQQPGAHQLQGKHQQHQHQHQRQHRAPRRSISWPLGMLYSALTWAQTAQLRHRHRSFWSRALAGLHTLPEGSERGSESSMASSMDTSSFRSSSSTQRDSIMSVVQPDATFEPAPWAAAGGRGSTSSTAAAGRPTSPAVKPRTSAAGAARSSLQRLAAAGAERRSSNANSAPAASRASQSSAPGAAAAASTSGYNGSGAAAGGGQPRDSSRRLSEAEQRIAALQSSLFAQAVLPPGKTAQLPQQMVAAGAAAAVTAAAAAGTSTASCSPDAPDTAAARPVGHTDDQQHHHHQKAAACADAGTANKLVSADINLSAFVQAAAAQPAAAAAAPAVSADKGALAAATAATATITADARTICVDRLDRHQQLLVAADAQQRVAHDSGMHALPAAAAVARPASDAAAEQRGVRVAAALVIVGQVEHCVSQLLLALLLPYCLCYLPSIMPGLQPPHIMAAMAQRPAWFEAVLLVLLWLHLYVGTSRRREAGCTRELHAAAVAAVADANAAVAAATEAAATAAAAAALSSDESTQLDTQVQEALAVSAARRRRRRQEHRLLRLRQRQGRLLARSLVSSTAAAAAIAATAYSQHLFVRAWLHTAHGGSTSGGSCPLQA